MTKEELKELENLKDFKVYVFEGDVYVKAEDFRKKAIECRELREELAKEGIRMDMMSNYNEIKEENKKLKSDYDRLDKVASENVRTLDELNAEIIELKEYRSIKIKTCNRYREKCEKMKKLFEEAEELLLMENLSSQHYWSRKEVINKIKEKLEELDL